MEKTFQKPGFWERQIKQTTVPGSGITPGAGAASDSSFQVQLHARAGSVRDTAQACLCSSRGKVPEVTCLRRGGTPRQSVLLKQEGEKVPERKDTGIALQ